MSLKKTILHNVTSGWMEKAIAIATVLITMPIIIIHFGKYEYGLWVTIGQTAVLLKLLDFGIANSVSRFISKHLALEEHDEVNRVFSTAIMIFVAASAFIAIATLIIGPFVASIFSLKGEYGEIAYWLFVINGLYIALILPFRVGIGLLQSKHKYAQMSYRNSLLNVVKTLAIVLTFGRGFGDLYLLLLINLVPKFIEELWNFSSGLRSYAGLKFSLRFVTKKNLREMMSLGGSALLQTLSGALYTKLPLTAIGIILGIGATPLYSVPNSLLLRVSPFISRLSKITTPIASSMDAKGENERLTKMSLLGVRYGLLISLPIGIFLVFFGESFLRHWIGDSDLSGDIALMAHVMSIMAIAFALGIPQRVNRSILAATGRHWFSATGFFIACVVGLTTSVILMKYTSLGIYGAAVGWCVKFILAEMLLYPIAIGHILHISFKRFFAESIWPPLKSALILLIFCYLLTQYYSFEALIPLLSIAAVFGIMSLLSSYFLVLRPEDRTYMTGLIRGRLAA